jgi:hypothetical protein
MASTPKTWFSSGFVTFTRAAQSAAQEAGLTLVGCLLRHLTGDFGQISDDQAVINTQVLDAGNNKTPLHDDIESRYALPDGQHLVFITHYIHSPGLRWTDICLDSEVVDGRPASDELTGEPDLDDAEIDEIIEAAG